jgi:hypothetical protein
VVQLHSLESHYAFFFGYGFVLTLLSFLPSSLVLSFAIFSLLYPFQVLAVLSVGEKVIPKFPEYPELGLDIASSSSSYSSNPTRYQSGPPPPRVNRHKPSDSITLIRSEMGDGGEEGGDLSGMSGSSKRMHPLIPIKLPVLRLALIGVKSLNKAIDEVKIMFNSSGGGKKKKKLAEGTGYNQTFGGNYQFGQSLGNQFSNPSNYPVGNSFAPPPPPPKSNVSVPPPPPVGSSTTYSSPSTSMGSENIGRRRGGGGGGGSGSQPMDNQRFI